MHAKSFQSYLILCDSMDCSPPGSSVHGMLQARILEWVAISSFKGIFWTQGLNPHLLRLLHWQAGSLPLVPPGFSSEREKCSVLHPKVHALTTWPPITWHFRPRSTWHPPATKGPRTWSWRPQAQSPGSWRTARAVHKVSAPAVAAVCKQLSGGGVAGHWAWLIWSWIKLYKLSHFWLILLTPHHETRA